MEDSWSPLGCTTGTKCRGKIEWAAVTSFVSPTVKCQNRELALPICTRVLRLVDKPWRTPWPHLKYVPDSRKLQAFDHCSLQRVFAARITFEKPHSEKQRLLSAAATGRKGYCQHNLKPAPCSTPESSWLSRAVGSAQSLHYEFSCRLWKEETPCHHISHGREIPMTMTSCPLYPCPCP